jgi:molecular chaperone IbpA
LPPLYRSTVGFDRLFDLLESSAGRPDWPPYNIEKTGEDRYNISMAVAGFGRSDIELTQHGNILLVTGQKRAEQEREILHRGIAFRNFKQTFNLADYMKVVSADLEDGLLSIELVREVPEQMKPRRIDIKASTGTISHQDNQPKQLDQNEGQHSKAA